LLDHGRVVSDGNTESVVNRYNFIIAKLNDKDGSITKLDRNQPSYGTFEANIVDVVIAGENSKSNVISSGETAEIRISIHSKIDLDDVTVGILIRDKFGQDIFGTNTYYQDNLKIDLKKDVLGECVFRLRMDIGIGKYTLTTALHSKNTHIENCFHWADNAASFEIAGIYGNVAIGLCKLYPEVEFNYIGSEGDHGRAKHV
jgi:lipopolysaccharide transport system ATP-binding protein